MRLSNGEVLLGWPLSKHLITAGAYYWNGDTKSYDTWHGAIDMRCNWNGTTEQPVMAAEDGKVSFVQKWDGVTKAGLQSYGNMVKISHAPYKGSSLRTRYAHLSRITVHEGDDVKAGQVIGYTGDTGNSFGAHLHFEVIFAGTRYNPLCWLDDDFEAAPGFKPYTYGPGEHAVKPEAPAPVELFKGIDTSIHQWENSDGTLKKPIDFGKVKTAGKEFVIARAGFGSYPEQKDPYFERTYQEATEAGLEVGAYWYSYAVSVDEALREADLFIETIRGKRLGMRAWFDQEYEPGIMDLKKNQRTDIVLAFCKRLEENGIPCGLYCSRDFVANWLEYDRLNGIELWVAAHVRGTTPGNVPIPYGVWQTDGGKTGTCDGVDGPCDLDTCYKDYPADLQGKIEFTPVKKMELVVQLQDHACEIFSAPDIATKYVIGALPDGQVLTITDSGYPAVEDIGGMTGIWYKVKYNASATGFAYVLHLPDRCYIREKPPVMHPFRIVNFEYDPQSKEIWGKLILEDE